MKKILVKVTVGDVTYSVLMNSEVPDDQLTGIILDGEYLRAEHFLRNHIQFDSIERELVEWDGENIQHNEG